MKTSLEIPDNLWLEAKKRALADGTTLASIVIRALTRFLNEVPERSAQDLDQAEQVTVKP
jgi:hypothetical protein